MRTTLHRPTRTRTTALAASLATAGLVLAACGDGGTDDTSTEEGEGSAAGASGTITMGFLPSWTDGLSMAIAKSIEKIRAWGGDTVRNVQTEHDVTFTFTLLETSEASANR